MWAILRAGGRVNGASPAYGAEEMEHALKTAKSKVLITLPSALKVALAAADNAGIPRDRVFLLEGKAEGFSTIQELMEIGTRYIPEPPWSIPRGQSNKNICGFLNCSSGTTGLPKAVSCRRSIVHGNPLTLPGHDLPSQHSLAVSPASPVASHRTRRAIQDTRHHASFPHHWSCSFLYISTAHERPFHHVAFFYSAIHALYNRRL